MQEHTWVAAAEVAAAEVAADIVGIVVEAVAEYKAVGVVDMVAAVVVVVVVDTAEAEAVGRTQETPEPWLFVDQSAAEQHLAVVQEVLVAWEC